MRSASVSLAARGRRDGGATNFRTHPSVGPVGLLLPLGRIAVITFQAHSDGHVLVPDEAVKLTPGARYRVSVEPVSTGEQEEKSIRSLRELLLSFAGTVKGEYPSDLAENHDHCLHGRPKRRRLARASRKGPSGPGTV